jgi:hypothetical protein
MLVPLGPLCSPLCLFPSTVWIPESFLSGIMSALIVTPTHQHQSDDFLRVPARLGQGSVHVDTEFRHIVAVGA